MALSVLFLSKCETAVRPPVWTHFSKMLKMKFNNAIFCPFVQVFCSNVCSKTLLWMKSWNIFKVFFFQSKIQYVNFSYLSRHELWISFWHLCSCKNKNDVWVPSCNHLLLRFGLSAILTLLHVLLRIGWCVCCCRLAQLIGGRFANWSPAKTPAEKDFDLCPGCQTGRLNMWSCSWV